MTSLFLLNEIFITGHLINILNIVSLLAIFSGIFVIISKNPIVSVLFLISLFGNISIYLNLLGLNFIGLSYLIVYIGAVSILFLFILMLINIRLSELQSNTINSIPLGILIVILLIYTIYLILPYNTLVTYNYNNILFITNLYKNKMNINYSNNLLLTTSNNWENNLINVSHISSLGNTIYTSHSLWLIITSFILLLAMVGAIVITIKK